MKITTINLARMINEVHAQFHESVKSLIERVTPEVLTIEDLYELYLQALSNEMEALLFIRKSENTEKISEQDRVRDDVFRGLSDTVKGFRNHFDPEFREAANHLWFIFLHYGNITRKSLDAQTAATNDMLRELRQPKNAQAMGKLQLTEWCNKMDEENQKFHQLMMQRYSEPVDKTAYRMKTARVDTDRYYKAMVAALDNRTLTRNVDAETNEFMVELNAIIVRYKNILAQQFGRKDAKKS